MSSESEPPLESPRGPLRDAETHADMFQSELHNPDEAENEATPDNNSSVPQRAGVDGPVGSSLDGGAEASERQPPIDHEAAELAMAKELPPVPSAQPMQAELMVPAASGATDANNQDLAKKKAALASPPAENQAAAVSPRMDLSIAQDSENKPRVLLVDDSRTVQACTGTILRKVCSTVTSMHSGEEFLEYAVSDLPSSRFDFILLDNTMGGDLHGIQALSTARSAGFTGTVIMHSADASEEFHLYADEVLLKTGRGNGMQAICDMFVQLGWQF